jgi:hypothetical protein
MIAAMRAWRRLAPVTIVMAAAVFAGCGGRAPTGPPAPTSVDTTAIQAAITASGLDVDLLFPSEVLLADTASLSAAALITPLAIRRAGLTTDDLAPGYAYGDTDGTGQPRRVVVARSRTRHGTLQIVTQFLPQDPTPLDSSDRIVDKAIDAGWARMFELQRAGSSAPWRVSGVSRALHTVVDAGACTPCAARLEELHIESGIVDVTFPGDLGGIDSLLHLVVSIPTRVTARVSNDAHLVLLHDASGRRVLRRVAPRQFAGALAADAPGLRHFTVEVISDSALVDDATPVSQHGLTIPYIADP